MLWASSGQRPRWCSTPSEAQDSPAQGPVPSITSRGSRLRNLGLEGNRLQRDHHESWLDIYIHTDISALQVCTASTMYNRGPETPLGRRRGRQGLGRCSEEGPALQDELKRTKGVGAGGRGECSRQRISRAKKSCVRRYCGWFWKQRF